MRDLFGYLNFYHIQIVRQLAELQKHRVVTVLYKYIHTSDQKSVNSQKEVQKKERKKKSQKIFTKNLPFPVVILKTFYQTSGCADFPLVTMEIQR